MFIFLCFYPRVQHMGALAQRMLSLEERLPIIIAEALAKFKTELLEELDKRYVKKRTRDDDDDEERPQKKQKITVSQ